MVASGPVPQVRKVISIPFVPLAVVAGCGKHHLQSALSGPKAMGVLRAVIRSLTLVLWALHVPQQRAPVCICLSCEQIS